MLQKRSSKDHQTYCGRSLKFIWGHFEVVNIDVTMATEF